MAGYTVGQDGRLTKVDSQPTAGDFDSPASGRMVVVRRFLSPAEISAIFADVNHLTFETAKLAGGTNGTIQADVRQSMVAWLPSDSLAGLQLAGAVKTIAGVPISNWDTVQVACYQSGMFFEWHRDAGEAGETYDYRLWTAVVELQSAPGGGLELDGCDALDLAPGDLALFPASLLHRATAPTSGIRFSLTTWFW